MSDLYAKIDRAAPFAFAAATAPALASFGLVAITTRLLATLGTGRGIDRTLNDRRCSLSLNLRSRFGGILRQNNGRLGRDWKRRNLDHSSLRLLSKITKQFLHGRNEELVNPNGINTILNKYFQTIQFHGFSELEVQP